MLGHWKAIGWKGGDKYRQHILLERARMKHGTSFQRADHFKHIATSGMEIIVRSGTRYSASHH
jgi:hypothetical protein